MATNISPSENDLKQALIDLRASNPTLGISKVHALLLSTHTTWTVSEKRTKKVLQSEGLVLSSSAAKNAGAESCGGVIYPSSRILKGLDISKFTRKVEVRYFGKSKGKGLVAKVKIAEGETIWKEDPFILAPEWELFDLQVSSVACAHCSTPLRDSPLVIPCRATSSSATSCTAKFCGRLCLSRSARIHPLLCSSQNPASVVLLAFARKSRWMSLHALVQCTARLMLTYQQDEASFWVDWEVFRGLARLSMEERAKGEWYGVGPDRDTWKKAYMLYVHAFREPPSAYDKKKFAKLVKRPLPEEIMHELFDYDAFLCGLGSMSLNLESHGGLYVLHSHMNHSCSPNISARHNEQRTALSRITAIARRDIEPGEELTLTYVDPSRGVKQRRSELLEWGFGTCQCERCRAEIEVASQQDASAVHEDDLEKELKAGLGVV
ncbi:SET domain-containing protein [Sparassis latifolia]